LPKTRGFIVDVSLKGTSLEPDADDIAAAYGEGVTPADVLTGRVRPPRQAQLLYAALARIEGGGGGDGGNGGGSNGSGVLPQL
jgi:lipid-binding SYLF domain-containing protein